MKKNIVITAVFLIFSLPKIVFASQITMDFNNQSIGPAPTVYTEGGARLSVTVPANARNTTLFNLGTRPEFIGYAVNTSAEASFILDLESGGLFDFLFIDLLSQSPTQITFQGINNVGGIITENFLSTGSFTTFIPSNDFSQLSSLEATIASGAGVTFLDNISLQTSSAPVTSSVPVPATVWLFCTGLVGLIGMRKKSLFS